MQAEDRQHKIETSNNGEHAGAESWLLMTKLPFKLLHYYTRQPPIWIFLENYSKPIDEYWQLLSSCNGFVLGKC